MKSTVSLVEVVLIVAVIVLLCVLGWSVHHRESVTMPKAYKAWVKQTGNTNALSYDEWRALIRANENNSSAIIFH